MYSCFPFTIVLCSSEVMGFIQQVRGVTHNRQKNSSDATASPPCTWITYAAHTYSPVSPRLSSLYRPSLRGFHLDHLIQMLLHRDNALTLKWFQRLFDHRPVAQTGGCGVVGWWWWWWRGRWSAGGTKNKTGEMFPRLDWDNMKLPEHTKKLLLFNWHQWNDSVA